MHFHWLLNLRARCHFRTSQNTGIRRTRRGKQRTAVAAQIQLLEQRVVLAAAFTQFVDPHPVDGNQFGATVTPLATGNVVVTAPFDDAGGTDAGAVYLFNGATGVLISTITGSTVHDQVGSGGVTALSNGNFVIDSPAWSNGAFWRVGAVTWGNGTTGVSGVVGADNSLVGSQLNDGVGGTGITALNNGNYVVRSGLWNNGTVADAGAVTWGDGTTGVSGIVSEVNSLVGSTVNDLVGSDIHTFDTTTHKAIPVSSVTILANGNYVVDSPFWDLTAQLPADKLQDVGAVTWSGGTTGVTGAVDSSNSLIGSQALDSVGLDGVKPLTNGNYVITSGNWNNGTVRCAGAVTWADGNTGLIGVVSDTNSLVGSSTSDGVGVADAPPIAYANLNSVVALSNGNYVVTSLNWDNGTTADVGAVTFANGTTGISGEISAANSLIGGQPNDRIGGNGVIELTNGNYVVQSIEWANGSAVDAGAVTFGNGQTGVVGIISASNSLVGSQTNDFVGAYGITPLNNGNYVVNSAHWANGAATNAGAVTLCNGGNPTTGVVSAMNSLVGTSANDLVGYGGITALLSGNYVIDSNNWSNYMGAVTWGDGETGVTGVISADNSLVGDYGGVTGDHIGYRGVVQLSNGNYVVASHNWRSTNEASNGAITWGSGTSGVRGVVSASNSLVGPTYYDYLSVGVRIAADNQPLGLYALSDGNYVVVSPLFDNGSIVDAGAVTWANGTTGLTGLVSASNSLVGTSAGDEIGLYGITLLDDGNYVVDSPLWDNGGIADVGAVTWGNAATGIVGPISAANSLVGSTAGDQIGSNGITPLFNGNYSVNSPNWDNVGVGTPSVAGSSVAAREIHAAVSPIVNAGAVTFGAGSSGVAGTISTANSSVGTTASSGLQSVTLDNVNHTFFTRFLNSNGGVVTVGSQVSGFANTAPTGIALTNKVVTLADAVSTATHIKVADIKITDDAIGTNVLSLSGPDAVSFELVGSSLYLKAGVALNALTKSTYSVTVSVKDPTLPNSSAVSANYSLNIHKNKPPVIGGFTSVISYTENGVPLLLDSAVTVADPDSANFSGGILTISLTGNAEAADRLQIHNQGTGTGQIGVSISIVTFGGMAIGTFTGGGGAIPLVVKLNANATPLATQALLRNVTYANVSDNPSVYTRTVTVSLTDGQGGTSSTAKKFIKVTAVNDPPHLSGIETTPLVYRINGVPVKLTSSLLVADPDSTILAGATVKITASFSPAFDQLTFTNTAKIKGMWDSGLKILTLSGYATVAEYQAALTSITFSNSSSAPAQYTRTISFQVSDGRTASNVVTCFLTIVNAPPVLLSIETTALSYQRSSPGISVTSTLNITDSDSPILYAAIIRIVGFKTGDVLPFTNTRTMQGDFNTVTGVLTLTGPNSTATYLSVFKALRFSNPSNKASTATRTISFEVFDGLAWSNIVSRQINVS